MKQKIYFTGRLQHCLEKKYGNINSYFYSSCKNVVVIIIATTFIDVSMPRFQREIGSMLHCDFITSLSVQINLSKNWISS